MAQPGTRKPATTARPSEASTLKVRAAAALSITSMPMPRVSMAASTAGGGNTWRGPVPSTIRAGARASAASRSAGSSSATLRGRQSCTSRAGVSRKLRAITASLTRMPSGPTPLRRERSSGVSRVNCIGSAPRQGDQRLLAAAAVQHGDIADPVDQESATAGAQVGDPLVAQPAVAGGHLHLHQFVLLEDQLGLGQQRIGDALGADHQHRLQVVRQAAQVALLGVGKGGGHGFWPVLRGALGYHGGPYITDGPSSPPWPAAAAATAGSRSISTTRT